MNPPIVGPVVLPNAMEAATKPRARPLLSSMCREAMMAPAMGAAIAKPSAMTHPKASNCANDPDTAARPAPAVYKASRVLKIARRPKRSPTLPKHRESLESMIEPIKPMHCTAAKLVLNSLWMADRDTLMPPTL